MRANFDEGYFQRGHWDLILRNQIWGIIDEGHFRSGLRDSLWDLIRVSHMFNSRNLWNLETFTYDLISSYLVGLRSQIPEVGYTYFGGLILGHFPAFLLLPQALKVMPLLICRTSPPWALYNSKLGGFLNKCQNYITRGTQSETNEKGLYE